MTSSLRNQLKWCTFGAEPNPFDYLKIFVRPFIHRYNAWKMNHYLDRELQSRYNSVLGKEHDPGKFVIDLALKAYLDENPSAVDIPPPFKLAAMAQIKLFIFAGA